MLHLKTKLQRNRNLQLSKMPKFWLAAVMPSLYFTNLLLFICFSVMLGRHTLCQALAVALAFAAWQCVWLEGGFIS
jgi:hypothetical protein